MTQNVHLNTSFRLKTPVTYDNYYVAYGELEDGQEVYVRLSEQDHINENWDAFQVFSCETSVELSGNFTLVD